MQFFSVFSAVAVRVSFSFHSPFKKSAVEESHSTGTALFRRLCSKVMSHLLLQLDALYSGKVPQQMVCWSLKIW